MTRLFVTGSGTEIGKSFVTAALVHRARGMGLTAKALKPVATGFDPERPEESDTGLLLAAQGLPLNAMTLAGCTPWRYAAPLAPDMAARREGKAVPFDQLVGWCQAQLAAATDVVLIEGVGGVMVPLDATRTVLDWAAALGVPALLVAGSYLGAISHALTACRVLAERSVAIHRVVVNETPGSPVDLEETAQTIARFVAAPVLTLPRLGCPEEAAPLLAAL